MNVVRKFSKYTTEFMLAIALSLLLPVGSALALPNPRIITPPTFPSSITLGQSAPIVVEVCNDGSTSDDGGISLSIPSFTSSTDGTYVQDNGSSIGYVPHAQGSPIHTRTGGAVTIPASYLLVESSDGNWINGKHNFLSIKVKPKAVGDFVFYVRSAMAAAGTTNYYGRPTSGTTDQQGWWVYQYTIRVVPVYPDLIVTNVTVNGSAPRTYKFGERVQVAGKVYNIGQGAAGSSRLGYYLETSKTNLNNRIDTDDVNSYPEEESTYYTFSSNDVSRHYFVLKADYLNAVAEGSAGENNNLCSFGPFNVVAPPPGPVLSPTPTHQATGVALSGTLSWAAANYATNYDVYFGTNPNPMAVAKRGPYTSASCTYSNLLSDTLYYWQVVAKNPSGASTGSVWNFRTGVVPPVVNATLSGIPGGATPQNVVWNIGGQAGSGNPATITGFPAGSQRVQASHQTTQTGTLNPWQEPERWVDQIDTFVSGTQTKTYTRNLPYAGSGVAFPGGGAYMVGQSVTNWVPVRNDTSSNLSVSVTVVLSTNSSFDSKASDQTSSTVVVPALSTVNIPMPVFTPVSTGQYYYVCRVRTTLAGTPTTTDTSAWLPAFRVSSTPTTVIATLNGIPGGATPQNVLWNIGGQAGSGNPATVTGLSAGSQRVQGSHQTTQGVTLNPWQESERWVDQSDTYVNGTQARTYTRKLPYAPNGVMFPGGTTYTLSQSVTNWVPVRNDTTSNLSVSVRVVISTTNSLSSPAYDQTSSTVVPANSTVNVPMPASPASSTGQFYYVCRVRTTLGGTPTTTDTTAWLSAFKVINTAGYVDATLNGISGGASPQNVLWNIGGRVGSGNPATITGLSAGSQRVQASHQTTQAYTQNPWQEPERWVDQNDMFVSGSQARTYVRKLPYAVDGVAFPGGLSYTLGQSVTNWVPVRNDTSSNLTVRVQVVFSTNSLFSGKAYDRTSSVVVVSANNTTNIPMPAFTPGSTGQYSYVCRVQTTLGGTNTTTDTSAWLPAFRVISAASCSINVTVQNQDGIPWPGAKVVSYLGGVARGTNITGESGQTVVTGLTAGQTVALEAYYEGANPFDNLGEMWADATALVTTGSNSVTLRRDYPYAEDVRIYRLSDNVEITHGGGVRVGESVRMDVVVRNKRPEARTVKVRAVLDRNQTVPVPGEFNQESNYQTIAGNNGTRTNSFTFNTIQSGIAYFAVRTQDQSAGKSDSWDWVLAFNASENASTQVLHHVQYYYQSDSDWCAFFSLSMLARYYGSDVTPWEVAGYFGAKWDKGFEHNAFADLFRNVILNHCLLGEYLNARDNTQYDPAFWCEVLPFGSVAHYGSTGFSV